MGAEPGLYYEVRDRGRCGSEKKHTAPYCLDARKTPWVSHDEDRVVTGFAPSSGAKPGHHTVSKVGR